MKFDLVQKLSFLDMACYRSHITSLGTTEGAFGAE